MSREESNPKAKAIFGILDNFVEHISGEILEKLDEGASIDDATSIDALRGYRDDFCALNIAEIQD